MTEPLGPQVTVLSRPPTHPGHRALLFADDHWSRQASARSSGDALPAMFDEDARILFDGLEVQRGAAAVQALRAESHASASQRWTPLRAEVSADESRGYSIGVLEWRRTPGDQDIQCGKYLAWWRRDSAGEWCIAAYLRLTRASDDESFHEVSAMDATTERGSPGALVGQSELDARVAEVLTADRAFSASGSVDLAVAFERWAAPDAVLLGSRPDFACGPRAIARSFDDMPHSTVLTWEPRYVDVAASGDLAITIGRGLLADTEAPERAPFERRYLCVWRRNAEGLWHYVADGGVAGPAP